MKYYSLDIKDILNELNTNLDGISVKEANRRLNKNGKNKLVEKKSKSNLAKFLDEFKDLMIIILLISALLSFIISIINKESFIDSIIIIAIVIINAILGFLQELKADKAISDLKKMQVTKVKVKRNKIIYEINSEELVTGDIIILASGDKVPADARIINSNSLKVDEASLTGESVSVFKNNDILGEDVPLANRTNMVYAGTNVVNGKCTAVVCKVGMNTEFGHIAEVLNQVDEEITPLQKKINEISKIISIIIGIIIVVMFIVGYIKNMNILEVFMLAISLAIAAIPEGLVAVITIILSLGMNELARKKAIVRKMSSIETLGCTEIICSDKTGTITQNKMEVQEIVLDNKIIKIEHLDKDNILFKLMYLNNDCEKSESSYIGDPTEIALIECFDKYSNIKVNDYKRIDEIPFDSNRKMMSSVIKFHDKIYLYTKGSFDSLIKHSKYILDNNKVIKLTKERKEKLKELEIIESSKAYRMLAYAYKEISIPYNLNMIEDDLIFVGLTAMIDPPRSDVKDAIKECIHAHIKPIMITGDSLSTAVAISKEIGIIDNEKEAISGEELDKMSYEELKNKLDEFSVYARVSPENKLNIVNAWKEKGKIVAMTGDGVNDAPALKSANIGVGMGINGTDVSKSVSDIILADDSFSTIVEAVKEGRKIYDNIRDVLVYLLTANIAEVLVVFICMLFGIEIFVPIQLLYINLITDSVPAIALSFEKEDNVMNSNVRTKDKGFFTPFLIVKIGTSAILKTIAILLVYYLNLKIYNMDIAVTSSFLTLILLELSFAFSCKNIKKSVINKKIFNNKFLNISIIVSLIIQIIVFISPIRNIFNLVSLNILQVIYIIFIVIVIFLFDELLKGLIRKLFTD